MKILTLHQPWASLVALGVKTIETRSWSTTYRGPLAIHAGAARPPLQTMPPHHRGRGPDPHAGCRWTVIDTITDDAYMGPKPQGMHVPLRAKTPTLFFPGGGPHGRPWDRTLGTSATEQGTAIHLPLGAIVATCALVAIVPMVDDRFARNVLDVHPQTLATRIDDEAGIEQCTDVTAQRPYGDFRPGRYAWLLDDVHPLAAPMPWRGAQGLRDLPGWALPAPSRVVDLMAALEESVRAAKAARRTHPTDPPEAAR